MLGHRWDFSSSGIGDRLTEMTEPVTNSSISNGTAAVAVVVAVAMVTSMAAAMDKGSRS